MSHTSPSSHDDSESELRWTGWSLPRSAEDNSQHDEVAATSTRESEFSTHNQNARPPAPILSSSDSSPPKTHISLSDSSTSDGKEESTRKSHLASPSRSSSSDSSGGEYMFKRKRNSLSPSFSSSSSSSSSSPVQSHQPRKKRRLNNHSSESTDQSSTQSLEQHTIADLPHSPLRDVICISSDSEQDKPVKLPIPRPKPDISKKLEKKQKQATSTASFSEKPVRKLPQSFRIPTSTPPSQNTEQAASPASPNSAVVLAQIAADEEYAKRLQLAPSPSKNRAEFEPIDQVLLFQSSGHTASSSRQNIQPQMRTHSRHTWRSNERSTATAHARRRSPSFTHWQHYEHDTFNVPSDYLTRRNALLSQPTIEAIQRDFTSDDYEMLLRLDEHMSKKGISKESLSRFPIREASDKLGQCCVCMEDMEAGNCIRTLPCLHSFHQRVFFPTKNSLFYQCIDKWLQQSVFCPIDKIVVGG